MRFLVFCGNQRQFSRWRTKGPSVKEKTNHARRRGLALQFKRWLKKLTRKAVVRRWLFIVVVKTIGWLVKRLWLDKDHTDLSP
jgi:hypothetical protein